ncbi:MAG: hypothetical protein VKP72_09310 [bacterium]|nr:hypothetical protein [bacterium]
MAPSRKRFLPGSATLAALLLSTALPAGAAPPDQNEAKRLGAALFTRTYGSEQEFRDAVDGLKRQLQGRITAGYTTANVSMNGDLSRNVTRIPSESELKQRFEKTIETGPLTREVVTVTGYTVDQNRKRVSFQLRTSEQSRNPRIFLFGNEQNGNRKVSSYIDVLLNEKNNDNTDLRDGAGIDLPPELESMLKTIKKTISNKVANTVVPKGKTLALTEMGDILVTNLDTRKTVETDKNIGVQNHGDAFKDGRYTSASIGGDLTIRGETYDVLATQLASPIALDLDHNGRIDVTGLATGGTRYDRNARFVPAGSVLFDLIGSGAPVRCEWLKPGHDGLLVNDADGSVSRAAAGNGQISGLQLFGGQWDANGYAKLARTHGRPMRLAALGKTGISPRSAAGYGPIKDPALETLKVWMDANGDARVQPDELRSCKELGITAINSEYELIDNEQEMRMVSWFEQGGKRHLSEDVWFAVDFGGATSTTAP